MMTTLPLLTLTLAAVSGDPTWTFTSPPATKHDTEPEVRSYKLDNPGYNAIITALRYEYYKIKVRLLPPKRKLNYTEDTLQPFKWIMPCVPKPDQNELTCVNYTDQNTTCNLFIDLPCKAKPGRSRWEANLLTDITVKKETNLNDTLFTIDDCQVVCLDIGYFYEDVYSGGNGISYELTGIIAAGVVIVASLVIFGSVYMCWRLI
ncbi:uncharacterized protein LOC131944732 [Physella acuta]|uniref:uncharacterized protein LOC131944732 n=1 Tax=Physella acuta TaxID=109671 RepID=UPI0027DDC15E|nr:uncharacterized protein LOC131944732 [Physella acuta]